MLTEGETLIRDFFVAQLKCFDPAKAHLLDDGQRDDAYRVINIGPEDENTQGGDSVSNMQSTDTNFNVYLCSRCLVLEDKSSNTASLTKFFFNHLLTVEMQQGLL